MSEDKCGVGWKSLFDLVDAKSNEMLKTRRDDRLLEFCKVLVPAIVAIAGIVAGYMSSESTKDVAASNMRAQTEAEQGRFELQAKLQQDLQQQLLSNEDRKGTISVASELFKAGALGKAQLADIISSGTTNKTSLEFAEQLKRSNQVLAIEELRMDEAIAPDVAAFFRDSAAHDLSGASDSLSRVLSTRPDAATLIATADPSSIEPMKEIVSSGSSWAPEEQEKLLADLEVASREALLNKLEFGAEKSDRMEAIIRLVEDFGDSAGLVERLIELTRGKVQVWTEGGVNVRLINTMDVLRKLDPAVLRANEQLIRNWLDTDIFGRVGPVTTTMADSLKKKLDEAVKNQSS